MTTTDPAGQPATEETEAELTPAQKLVYAALGALAANREDRADALMQELATEHGDAGVREGLELLCRIPTHTLRHLCSAGGGAVEVAVPQRIPPTARDAWVVAAQAAGELLGATFGAHPGRLRNAFAMINKPIQVPVLILLAHYVTDVLEGAAEASGEAWTAYDQTVADRSKSKQPGWST